jgi:hypothetical protein
MCALELIFGLFRQVAEVEGRPGHYKSMRLICPAILTPLIVEFRGSGHCQQYGSNSQLAMRQQSTCMRVAVVWWAG